MPPRKQKKSQQQQQQQQQQTDGESLVPSPPPLAPADVAPSTDQPAPTLVVLSSSAPGPVVPTGGAAGTAATASSGHAGGGGAQGKRKRGTDAVPTTAEEPSLVGALGGGKRVELAAGETDDTSSARVLSTMRRTGGGAGKDRLPESRPVPDTPRARSVPAVVPTPVRAPTPADEEAAASAGAESAVEEAGTATHDDAAAPVDMTLVPYPYSAPGRGRVWNTERLPENFVPPSAELLMTRLPKRSGRPPRAISQLRRRTHSASAAAEDVDYEGETAADAAHPTTHADADAHLMVGGGGDMATGDAPAGAAEEVDAHTHAREPTATAEEAEQDALVTDAAHQQHLHDAAAAAAGAPHAGAAPKRKKVKNEYRFSRRPRTKFSPEEVEALQAGYAKYGPMWTKILRDPIYSTVFLRTRTAIDLKDKYRNLFCKQKLPEKRTYELLGASTRMYYNSRFPQDAAERFANQGYVHIVLRRVDYDVDPTVHIYSGSTVMREAPDIPRFARARENMAPAKVAHVEKKHEYPSLELVPERLRKSTIAEDAPADDAAAAAAAAAVDGVEEAGVGAGLAPGDGAVEEGGVALEEPQGDAMEGVPESEPAAA